MELYLAVLKSFLQRENWKKYNEFIDKTLLRKNYPELFRLFVCLDRLHIGGGGDKELIDLSAQLYTDYPQADPSTYSAIFDRVSGIECDRASVGSYLDRVRSRGEALKAAFGLLDFAEGKVQEPAPSRELVESYLALKPIEVVDQAAEFGKYDFEAIIKEVNVGGLNWRLRSLNQSLGPIRKGNFGVVFARPETGKTTFLASELSHFITQADRPIIWFNNEQPEAEVRIRIMESVLGASWAQIQRDYKKAEALFGELGGNKILLKDAAYLGKSDVERILGGVESSCIVFDQLDKVRGFDSERDDLRLGTVYQWARELSKEFAPVIGVSQAGDSASGVKWLNMEYAANARTSKQAEADWMLGIGLSYDDPPNVRGFSVCKNKLLGGPETVPELRHGKFEVLIEPEIARYRDVHA
jgi:AAA domain